MKKLPATEMLSKPADGRYRRMHIQEQRLRAGTLGYAPGDIVGLHSHRESDEVFYVIEGGARFTVDGEVVDLQAGDLLHAGADEKHEIQAGEQGLVLLAVVAPNLDDAWEPDESQAR